MLPSCPRCLSLYHSVSLGTHTSAMGSLWGPQVTLRNENILTESREFKYFETLFRATPFPNLVVRAGLGLPSQSGAKHRE